MVRKALGLDGPAPAEFVAAVHARCEGNPFFIEEVLKALAERGALRYENGSWRNTESVHGLVLPESVRVAVEQRTRVLSADAVHAMHVAAVIGARFDFDLLRVVSGATEAVLVSALHTAIEAQLIVDEADDQAQERCIRHALTREAVLVQLLQRERRLLHRAVGDALEARALAGSSGHAAELAYHFDEAGDAIRARQHHDAAGREALRAFAFAGARAHFERAIQLATPNDAATPEQWQLLARAALLTNDMARAAAAADEVIRIFGTGEAEKLGGALFAAVGVSLGARRDDDSVSRSKTEPRRSSSRSVTPPPSQASTRRAHSVRRSETIQPRPSLSQSALSPWRDARATGVRRSGRWKS